MHWAGRASSNKQPEEEMKRLRVKEGSGVWVPLDCQRAVSPQLFNPLGAAAPLPGGVNYLQSHRVRSRRRGCSEVGSKINREGLGFPRSQSGCTRHCLISSPRRQQSPSRTQPQDPAASSSGAQEPAFIWHSQSWLICCSADCSSLQMEGAQSPQQTPRLFSLGPTANEQSRSAYVNVN